MSGADAPAYPAHDDIGVIARGLTKRELFAAMAMQGLAASDGFFKDEALKATAKHLGIAGPSTVAVILAKTSMEFADALLAALDTETAP